MTAQSQSLKFEGKDMRQRLPGAHGASPHEPEPYIAGKSLVTAVNLAIALRRPLLLEGDPGCGKTCLAKAVAFELGLPYFRWNVQSVSKAKDGLYTYDALGRLHDVQLRNASRDTLREPGVARDYCQFGALGRAFEIQDVPSVVLIDEIDKAELDFPNDLLTVLDKPWQFEIQETGEKVTANPQNLPIVFITSNKEKGNLPDAFLRRCLYHYVEFPGTPGALKQIVDRHYQLEGQTPPDQPLQGAAIDRFLEVRTEGGLIKRPGTSEFLDWLKALQSFVPGNPYPVAGLQAGGQDGNKPSLPYPELLLKVQQDWRKFKAAT
jgi:MoxR-like ATPase